MVLYRLNPATYQHSFLSIRAFAGMVGASNFMNIISLGHFLFLFFSFSHSIAISIQDCCAPLESEHLKVHAMILRSLKSIKKSS